jgi:hypothetical protein
VKATEDRVDRFVSRVCKVCKPVTVLSVIVVTIGRLLNKPVTNLNGVFSRKTRYSLTVVENVVVDPKWVLCSGED